MKRTVLIGLVAVLAGCSQPQPVPSPEFDPELGQAPTVIESEPSPAAAPTPSAPSPGTIAPSEAPAPSGDHTPRPDSTPVPQETEEGPASPSPETNTTTAPAPSEPLVLLAVADAAGDHGAQGPGWADLRSLEFVEIGNDLRVTLRFDGELPATPPESEVPLVGVDIGDDGYQLFVEGGGQSWAAHLDTPDGFVEYPGTFELAGRALVLQVPFSAVGSPTRAPVRSFVEWSRDSGTLGVLNPTSEDQLDGQPHTFDRNP